VRWENKNIGRWPNIALVLSVPKKLCKQTVLVQINIKDVVTCYLGTQYTG